MDHAEPPHVTALFVYGTLKRQSKHPMAKRLMMQSEFTGEATIGGKLFSLGSYPGLALIGGPADLVHGEVVRLRTPELSFRWIDEYEGCGPNVPEPHYFRRVVVPVALRSGATLDAWVYVYLKSISPARHIPGGRWKGPSAYANAR
jgi:gamma-glutamylcyclotransferase (GGCT)/AIG2-like uncharacterized protein YtfP